ncbi:MAG: ABC-three component system protein [Sarcina sp.]
MEIDEQFCNRAVFIKCKEVEGSGCLIQPQTEEYSYVLTARHCLIGKEEEAQEFKVDDIEILRYKDEKNESQVEVLEFYLHDDNDVDLAIIKVEFLEGIEPIEISESKFGEYIYIWGYPNILYEEDDCNKLDYFKGIVGLTPSEKQKKLEFKMDKSNETADSLKSTNLQGFSGSGIFSENEKRIRFHGIFEGLKDVQGRLDGCLGYGIKTIGEFISKNKLSPLVHFKLNSFECYKKNSFDSHEENIEATLNRNSTSITEITPYTIINKKGRKLFMPYRDGNIYEDRLWEGWLKALTYLKISGIDINDIENIDYENGSEGERYNIKVLYALQGKKFKEILRSVFEEVESYQDLSKGNILIINSSEEIRRDHIYSRTKMEKIVLNINNPMMIQRGLYIDMPGFSKNISGIHINEFSNRIDSWYEDCEEVKSYQIEDGIKNTVREVLVDAIK